MPAWRAPSMSLSMSPTVRASSSPSDDPPAALFEPDEILGRTTILRGRFVCGADADEQRFVERPGDEIHADRQPRGNRADELRALSIALAVPYLGREAAGHGDGRKTLLADQRPPDRRPSVD